MGNNNQVSNGTKKISSSSSSSSYLDLERRGEVRRVGPVLLPRQRVPGDAEVADAVAADAGDRLGPAPGGHDVTETPARAGSAHPNQTNHKEEREGRREGKGTPREYAWRGDDDNDGDDDDGDV